MVARACILKLLGITAFILLFLPGQSSGCVFITLSWEPTAFLCLSASRLAFRSPAHYIYDILFGISEFAN